MTTPSIPYHQYAVQLWLIQPDNTHVPVPYSQLNEIMLTDGSGLSVANQITVKYKLEEDLDVNPDVISLINYTHIYVVQRVIDTLRGDAIHDVVHGPYDVLTEDYDNESRLITITGTQNLFWEERLSIAGTATEVNIVNQIHSLFDVSNYGNIEPYKGWIDSMGLETMLGFINADLIKVKAFSELVSALERWGFTGYTQAGISGVFRKPEQVVFVPRYPVDGRPSFNRVEYQLQTRRGYVDLDAVILHSNFEIFENVKLTIPAAVNRPDTYKTRRIVSGFRAFAYSDDVQYLLSGDEKVGPVIYKDNLLGQALTQLEHDTTRWELQNTSVEVSFEDSWPMPDVHFPNTPLFPLHFYIVPHQRLRELGYSWRVESVTHKWSSSEGYIRTINAYLWQGFFERVPGVLATS